MAEYVNGRPTGEQMIFEYSNIKPSGEIKNIINVSSGKYNISWSNKPDGYPEHIIIDNESNTITNGSTGDITYLKNIKWNEEDKHYEGLYKSDTKFGSVTGSFLLCEEKFIFSLSSSSIIWELKKDLQYEKRMKEQQEKEEKIRLDGGRKIPDVTVKNLDNSSFQTGEIENDGKPIIINFWATWCTPCKRELNTIAEEYQDWVDETGVKLVAISIDDARNMHKVKPYIDGQGWEYEVYIDPNADFKRAMNVNNVPHTFLVDGEGNIVWQHNSYAPGDEMELYDLVEKLAAGESIN